MTLESSERPESSFESAFSRPERVAAEGGRLDVVVLEPKHLKSQIPVVLVPGWSATALVHRRNAVLFAEAGRRTLVISAPHGICPASEQRRFPLAEMRKAAAVARVLEAKNIDKADVVAHSEAAIFVTIAALEQPEHYRSVTYVAPAGLIGEDGFWRLAQRFHADGLRQLLEAGNEKGRWPRMLTAFRENMKAVASAPVRALEEVIAISYAQIQNDIRAVHAKGVKVFVVHPVGDQVFPMPLMNPDTWDRDANGRPMGKKGNVGKVIDRTMIDGFISAGDPSGTGAVSDTHNGWYLSPKKYTPAVAALLDSLDVTRIDGWDRCKQA